MVNSIISAISVTLYDEFGENYEIYKEKVLQGLKEPCFFISCINPITENFRGSRYVRYHQFCIQYINDKGTNAQKYDVLNRFCKMFEVLNVEDIKIRGTNFSSNDDGEALSFFVNFDTAYFKVLEETEMEEIGIGVKNGIN